MKHGSLLPSWRPVSRREKVFVGRRVALLFLRINSIPQLIEHMHAGLVVSDPHQEFGSLCRGQNASNIVEFILQIFSALCEPHSQLFQDAQTRLEAFVHFLGDETGVF